MLARRPVDSHLAPVYSGFATKFSGGLGEPNLGAETLRSMEGIKMGRGRPFAGHKIVPPIGARWAPKPNARARCMRVQLLGQKGGGRAGVLQRWMSASDKCEIKGK